MLYFSLYYYNVLIIKVILMITYLLKNTVNTQNKTYSSAIMAFSVLLTIYAFVLAISLLQATLKLAGHNYLSEILNNQTANPFVGLFIGLLATALIQSSSTTTSVLVLLVSSRLLGFQEAVYMIMGANIGTTITSTFVGLSYFSDKNEFRRAIPTATAHDFFNICSTMLLFPLEYYFGMLSKIAVWFVDQMPFLQANEKPLNLDFSISKALVNQTIQLFDQNIWILFGLAVLILLVAIKMFAQILKFYLAENGQILTRYLDKDYKALLTGFVLTSLVQSSSAVTSMIIPVSVARKITLNNAFCFIMGSNVGTTLTAVFVALDNSTVALQLALVHVIFNILGVIVFFPIPFLRRIPIILAKKLGRMAWENQIYGFLYIVFTFFLIPYILISLSRLF